MDIMRIYRVGMQTLKIAPPDFWKMPPFVLADLLTNHNVTGDKAMSRKELLTLEREAKIKYGWA